MSAIYIAQNCGLELLSKFVDPHPIIYGGVNAGDKHIDITLRLSLMLKYSISYTNLRLWFQKNYQTLLKQGNDYHIEILYNSMIYDCSDDKTIYKLRIDFTNDRVYKYSDDYWLMEDILFDEISFAPALPSGVDECDGDNLLAELESLSGI